MPGATGRGPGARRDRVERARAAGYAVRAMTRADADDVTRVHAQVWRETYPGLMRPETLDGLDPVAAADRWRAAYDSGAPVPLRLAMAPDGSIAGMISVGASRDDDPPVPTELRAINVLAAHHGTGVADLLVADALGDEPASLWVVAGNARALAFYDALGFTPDGARKDDDMLLPGVHEVRLVRR